MGGQVSGWAGRQVEENLSVYRIQQFSILKAI